MPEESHVCLYYVSLHFLAINRSARFKAKGVKMHVKQSPQWDFAEPSASQRHRWARKKGGKVSRAEVVFFFPWKGYKNSSAVFENKTLILSLSLGIRPETTRNFPTRYPAPAGGI